MSNKRILVIEDQNIIALDIKYILESENYIVDTNYKSVEHVTELINNNPPDLLLLDINLNEKKTGLDIAEYLLKKETIPYIFITEYTDKSTMELIKKSRPHGIIVKPYKTEDIIATVFLAINNFYYKKSNTLQNADFNKIEFPIQIKDTLNYIDQNLHKKIEVSQLAALTRWDTPHFTRVFKQFVQMTPYQYILKQKINASKQIIVTSNDQLHAIAEDFGFSSYSNYCNAFKKMTNMSPENYRIIKQSFKK